MPRYLEPMKATLATKPFRRRGLAVRGQVGRLPRRGSRARREGRAVHAQRQRRRDVLPAPADAADLDRCPRGDRRRRGRRARRGRTAGLQPAPGADQRRARPGRAVPLVYQAFDLLYLDGRSLLDVPLEERKRLLELVLRPNARVRFATHIDAEGVAFFEAAKAQGLEGIIAKHRRSPLRAGPSLVRVAEDQGPAGAGARRRRLDAGRGQRQGAGAVVVGVYDGRPAAVRRQGRLGVHGPDPHRAPGRARGPRDRAAAVRSRAATGLPRPLGRRPCAACAGSGRSS